MVKRIIQFSIRHKLIIGLMVCGLIAGGLFSLKTINLGAKPDITNNQVQVITVSPNLATMDVEQFITYPIELTMGNLPGIKEIRSTSRFGLSVITLVFEDDMGKYLPRQLVQEKLNDVKEEIPTQFGNPEIGPITTGLGEIYQYTIDPLPGYESKYTPQELRTIQDWIIKRQLSMVKGVVEVNAFGGSIKQYEITLDPNQLNSMNTTISDVFNAIKVNNLNTGGAYIEERNSATFIRGEGLVHSIDDIKNIVVKTENGHPILVKDIAKEVRYGSQVRYGAFTKDGKEAVGGMVLMLRDANPYKTIQRVKKRVAEIQKQLPEGLEINSFLDRSELIQHTTHTIAENLILGALIIVFVLILLLGSIRGGLITASLIPLSLLFAFILMHFFGVSANLMSLGAIDFGIIVDGAVIIVEGVVFQTTKYLKKNKIEQFTPSLMNRISIDASSTMMSSAFYGQLIILIVFTPILFLTGIEGKMFRPMAYTFGFAILGAILLCLTYVPMISALLMRPLSKKSLLGRIEHRLSHFSHKIIDKILSIYHSIISNALKVKWGIIGGAALLLFTAGFTFSRMGGEFIPELDEGDIAMHLLLRPGSALSETIQVSETVEDSLLANFPEIKTVTARIGVADIPTDPMPMDIADLFIILNKNKDEWVSASSKKELILKIKEKLSFLTGVNLVFSQPIEMRFNELLTGVQEDIAIKLYGPDLSVLTQKKKEIAGLIQNIPGVAEVNPERTSGLPQIVIDYNRQKIAQYGLNIKKLNNYVNVAFAGGTAGQVFEGAKRFNIVVRFDSNHRESIKDVRNLFVDLPNHTQIPLRELATIEYQTGPMQISRENTFRYISIGVNTNTDDVESIVYSIQNKLDKELDLPPGYHLKYGGSFQNLQKAKDRLTTVIPIALALIFLLLYFALKSFKEALMIYVAVPLSAIGGIFFLSLRGMPFSISAGVGFIVLFGVSVLNGLVLISRFNDLEKKGISLRDRIIIGTEERLRPILLTATAAIMGFVPMAFSTSAGAEVQRPLATVVIGGLISATILTLIVLPVIYSLLEKGKPKKKNLIGKNSALPIVVGLLLFCPTVFGQDSLNNSTISQQLTRKEAVQRAIDYYPQLQIKALAIQKETALKKTRWDFGTTQVYTGKEEFNRNNKGVTTLIGVSQTGIDLFGIASKTTLHKKRIEWAKFAYRAEKETLKKEVKKAWDKVYIAQKKMLLYQQLDSLFTKISRYTQKKYQWGEIAKLEYLAGNNKAKKVHLTYQEKQYDYKMALYSLNLYFVSDTLFTIDTLGFHPLNHSLIKKDAALASHPKLQLAQQGIAISNSKIKREKSKLFPKISGSYGLQRINGMGQFNAFQIGISIPLIFNQQAGAIKAAKLERKKAEAHYKMIQSQFFTAYQKSKINYLKWKNSWEYYHNTVLPLAIEQRKVAQASYLSGAINYTTFIQNINNALQMELDYWTTLQNLLNSQIEYKYYTHKN